MSKNLLNIKPEDDISDNTSVESRTKTLVMGNQKMREHCTVCGDGFGDNEKEVENTNDTVKNFIDECEAEKSYQNMKI